MRWTRECLSGTPRTRTAKPCGPDAPTLASSRWKYSSAMVANKPGHQGELEGNRNTIAQGRPGVFQRTCGRLPCAFYLLHTGLWVRHAPGFPCAFSLKVAEMNFCKLGRIVSRAHMRLPSRESSW